MKKREGLLELQAKIQMLQGIIEEKNQEIEEKDRIIERQNIRIENMIQALLHARKKMFGPSTEASKGVDGQPSLFETAPDLADELQKEQKKITVSPRARKPRQPGVRAKMLDGLPKEIAGCQAGGPAGREMHGVRDRGKRT